MKFLGRERELKLLRNELEAAKPSNEKRELAVRLYSEKPGRA